MNQQSQRQWTPVETSGSNNPRWEPTKMVFDKNNPPSLEGYFKTLREISGPNGIFKVATMTLVNLDGSLGQDVDVSGGAVLDEKLSKIPLGSFIMIKFTGKFPSKTPGRTYNTWDILLDEGAINLNQLVPAASVAPVAAQHAQPVFQQPVNTQPVFQQPVQVQPQFVPPAVNSAPVQPQFQQPVQFTQQPVQTQPQFTQPVQSAPVPQQPNFSNPFNTGDDLPF